MKVNAEEINLVEKADNLIPKIRIQQNIIEAIMSSVEELSRILFDMNITIPDRKEERCLNDTIEYNTAQLEAVNKELIALLEKIRG